MPPADPNATSGSRARTADAVFHAIHAQLRSKERRPVLGHSDGAVWLTWRVDGHAPLEFRVDDPAWTESDPSTLAGRLLTGIREELRLHEEKHGAAGA